MMNLGPTIREVRERRGMSQEALGKAVGVTQGAIAHIEGEQRRITVDMLERIAVALELTSSGLINMAKRRQKREKAAA